MKRTKPIPSRTQSFQSALRIWDDTSKAHNQDVNQRGKAMLDTQRLKLMLAQKLAFIELNKQFQKLINA